MIITDQAIAHITEQALKEGSNFGIFIEEYLTKICTNETIAGKLLNPEKSLIDFCKDAEKKARTEAANRGGGTVRIAGAPDHIYYEQVEEYYNITDVDKTGKPKRSAEVIDITDFL